MVESRNAGTYQMLASVKHQRSAMPEQLGAVPGSLPQPIFQGAAQAGVELPREMRLEEMLAGAVPGQQQLVGHLAANASEQSASVSAVQAQLLIEALDLQMQMCRTWDDQQQHVFDSSMPQGMP